MAINTDIYSDIKASQGHLGFLFFIFLDLLSKDVISSAQSTASIFIGLAIPLLSLTIILLPNEHDELNEEIRPQVKIGALAFIIGHMSGILAITIILYGFNIFAGLLFLIAAAITYLIFTIMLLKSFGIEQVELIYEYLFGKPLFDEPESTQQNSTPLLEVNNTSSTSAS